MGGSGEISALYATIGAKTDGFEGGLTRVKDGLTGLSGQLQTAGTLLGVTFGVMGVRAVADYTLALGKAGAEHKRLETSFQGLAKAPEALMRSLKAASGQTISTGQLMLDSNKAVMLGLGSDSEKMGQLMEGARYKARALGITTAQAYSDMVTGIGRLSPEILDNEGITIDADRTYRAYAASLGKAANALSEVEKKQALLNRVIEETQADIKRTNGLVDDLADPFERLDASTKDLKANVGLIVAPFTSELVTNANNFVFALKTAIDLSNKYGAYKMLDIVAAGAGWGPMPKLPPEQAKPYAATWPANVMAGGKSPLMQAMSASDMLGLTMGRGRLGTIASPQAQLPPTDAEIVAAKQRVQAYQDLVNRTVGAFPAALSGVNKAIDTSGLTRYEDMLNTAGNQTLIFTGVTDSGASSVRLMAGAVDTLAGSLQNMDHAMGGWVNNWTGATFGKRVADMFDAAGWAGVATVMPGQGYGFMDTLTDTGTQDRLKTFLGGIAADNARAAEQIGKNWADAGKQASDQIKGFIKGAFTSMPDNIRAGLVGTPGQLGNAWDERARRIEDIGNLGGKSPWAAGETGWQGLNDEQRKAWAAGQAWQIRNRPSLANLGAEGVGGLTKNAIEGIQAEVDRKALEKKIMQEIAANPQAVANLKTLGIDIKDAFADPSDKIAEHVDSGANAIVIAIRGLKLGGGGGEGGGQAGPGGSLSEGMTDEQKKEFDKWNVPVMAAGGVVGGGAVPILAHLGEWVINKRQQDALLDQLNGPQIVQHFHGPITVKTDDPSGFFEQLSAIL